MAIQWNIAFSSIAVFEEERRATHAYGFLRNQAGGPPLVRLNTLRALHDLRPVPKLGHGARRQDAVRWAGIIRPRTTL